MRLRQRKFQRLKSADGQVERYIKKVDDFFVRFNDNSKVALGEYLAYIFLYLLYSFGGLVYHCKAIVTVKADADGR